MTSAPRSPHPAPSGDVELLERLADARRDLLEQVGQRIIGQRDVLDGHPHGDFLRRPRPARRVPGLAKTLMVQTLAETLDLGFTRIQFTPTSCLRHHGTEIIEEDLNTGKRGFASCAAGVRQHRAGRRGQSHAAKTQAALLQAMQEHQVSAAGQTHHLPSPFFVLATQNPIEQEGTYPLPEAQLDRFMFELRVDYPSQEEEEAIVAATTGEPPPTFGPC